MATIDSAKTLLTSFTNCSFSSRSANDVTATTKSMMVLSNAIMQWNNAFQTPLLAITYQAQLLQNWTSSYAAAFAAADMTARQALKAASQSVPGPMSFDVTSATNAVLVARLASATGFTPATSTSILLALQLASASLSSAFANPPNQNDTTALAAVQSAATSALAAAYTDAAAVAVFAGVVLA